MDWRTDLDYSFLVNYLLEFGLFFPRKLSSRVKLSLVTPQDNFPTTTETKMRGMSIIGSTK